MLSVRAIRKLFVLSQSNCFTEKLLIFYLKSLPICANSLKQTEFARFEHKKGWKEKFTWNKKIQYPMAKLKKKKPINYENAIEKKL